ncbi:MAG TPA: hypothetical protein DEH25_04980 [Chloroflexi bacterium]|nr:hypothetical protein [Chloroflexota bacterium]HBY07669.1 hypothetical protein [Chloroflexota bacterium]
MHKLIITTLATPGKAALDVLLLAESLRTFGGELADSPIRVMVPAALGPLSEAAQCELARWQIETIPFEADEALLKFPFAAKIAATAQAESLTRGQSERLVFMDADTLILQEPAEFLLSPGKTLGYRPVHHQLIGAAWGHPLDDFWRLIYEICEVPDENTFPMLTHTGEQIYPYFNAGMFIVRPERGLLTQWLERFQSWYRQPQLRGYYEKNQLYAIFIHQAIFTGVLLAALSPLEMQLLSPKINYPLHLHADIPAAQRPATIAELVTVRYESIFDDSGWRQLPITGALQSWLESQPRVRDSLSV